MLACVAGYIAIKKAIAEAMAQLTEAAAPLVAQAEVSPLSLLNELVNKPVLEPHAATNEGKNRIVSQALIEREPKLLKKVKLKTIVEVGTFISKVYPSIFKPLVKAIKRQQSITLSQPGYRCEHFLISKLISPATFRKYGQRAWDKMDWRLLTTLDAVRDRFGPTVINNWLWGQYCLMLPPEDFRILLKKAKDKHWDI